MKPIEFLLEEWTMNSIYDRVKNCVAIKPTHMLEKISSNSFMLDKRPWLVESLSQVWQSFTDYIDVEWSRYYYWKDLISGNWRLFNSALDLIWNKSIRDTNPIRLLKWRC